MVEALVARLEGQDGRTGWGDELARLRRECETRIRAQVAPQMAFVDAIRASLPADGIFVNELTQIGYVSTYGFPVQAPRSYVWPGYQGTLGYAMPTALGAAVGAGDRPVVVVTGDGGIGWSLSMTLLGFTLGKQFPGITKRLDMVIIIIILISVMPIVISYLKNRKKNVPPALAA